jgi:pimeloyl-ACP methyl ester carboxylesterase
MPCRRPVDDQQSIREHGVGTVTTTDGTEIFYKDWGSGQPIVFSHGWPLSADDWDNQMLFFLRHGYRVIAHDRRGHGRSTQTGDGHDMDHYADDLAALTNHLDLHDAVHVGHSTGGGEVVRYLARHGESRVAKAVLISVRFRRSWSRPTRTPAVCRRACSTITRSSSPPTDPSSTARWPRAPSTATTVPARSPRNPSSATGGARE